MQDNFNFDEYINGIIPDLEVISYIIAVGIGLFILMYFVRKFLRLFRSKMPNVIDGLIIILNFSSLLIWVIFSVDKLGVDATAILGGTVFTVTIIGISVSYLASNLMGGIFIVITRPFGVGDIITYSGSRGLVTEIGLNYTKILKINKTIVTIPNSNIVNALIHNSTIFVKHDQKKSDEVELNLKNDFKNGKSQIGELKNLSLKFSSNKFMKPFIQTLDLKRVTRYTFTVELRQDISNISISEIEERLNALCKEFIDEFGFEPEFFFQDNYWRVKTTFIITSLNPRLVFENFSPLLEGILKSLYNIDTGGI